METSQYKEPSLNRSMVLFKRYLQGLGLLINPDLIQLPKIDSLKCNQEETITNLALAFKVYLNSILDD